jgi:hypothetical protein
MKNNIFNAAKLKKWKKNFFWKSYLQKTKIIPQKGYLFSESVWLNTKVFHQMFICSIFSNT